MRGGLRPNAGRPKGKLGKRTKMNAGFAEEALLAGLTPLEYMLSILRDASNDQAARFAAAKEAAPYLHPRLAAIEHRGDADSPVVFSIVSGVPRGMIEAALDVIESDDASIH